MAKKKDSKDAKEKKLLKKEKKKTIDYFEMFIKQVDFTCKSIQHLCDLAEDYTNTESKIQKIHELEHEADKIFHSVESELYTAFITPIEREDILMLANTIDDLTDSIEDIAIRFRMFNIKNMREEVSDFLKIISDCCQQLQLALKEFHSFKKSKSIASYIVEINRLEGEGDILYQKAVYHLFTSENNPVEIIKWRETFEIMENCCDTCEEVANTLGAVIMKNS